MEEAKAVACGPAHSYSFALVPLTSQRVPRCGWLPRAQAGAKQSFVTGAAEHPSSAENAASREESQISSG